MFHKRHHHTLHAFNEELYAVAGRFIAEGNVTSIEVYNPLSNQWTVALPHGPDVFAASSLVINNKIYIIGGCHCKQVSVYDVDNKKVVSLPKELPYDSKGNASAFMTLPNLL